MRSKIVVPAPSSSLLRFLKYQSEGACFFSANPGNNAFTFDHAAPRACQPRAKQVARHSALLTPAVRKLPAKDLNAAPLQAGFLNLDFLWPRAVAGRLRRLQTQEQARQEAGGWERNVQSAQFQRNISTDTKWWKRRLRPEKKQRYPALKPEDLPLGVGFRGEEGMESMFSLNRTVSGKAANELKLRCTEFDENGNVVLVNGEFKKSELIAKVPPLRRVIFSWHPQLIELNLVQSASPRSSQDRLVSASAYSHSSIRYPDQFTSSPLSDKGQPCPGLRRLWVY